MLRALHIIMNKQSVGWLYISLIIHLSLAYTPPPSFILTWQMNHNLTLEQYWSFIIIINFIMSIIIYGTHLINIHLQIGYWLKFISFIIIVDLMLAVMRASMLIIIIIYRIQTIYLTSLLIFLFSIIESNSCWRSWVCVLYYRYYIHKQVSLYNRYWEIFVNYLCRVKQHNNRYWENFVFHYLKWDIIYYGILV